MTRIKCIKCGKNCRVYGGDTAQKNKWKLNYLCGECSPKRFTDNELFRILKEFKEDGEDELFNTRRIRNES